MSDRKYVRVDKESLLCSLCIAAYVQLCSNGLWKSFGTTRSRADELEDSRVQMHGQRGSK